MADLRDSEREELEMLRKLYKIILCYQFYMIAHKLTDTYAHIQECKTWYFQNRIKAPNQEYWGKIERPPSDDKEWTWTKSTVEGITEMW